MAQRYPDDFDGILARVPVINWVGLQHAGTRSGLVTMGEGWINPAQVKLVGEAVRTACDKADGSDDALVQDPVACKAAFKVETLRCVAVQSGDQCLTDAQIKAVDTLHAMYNSRPRSPRPRRLSGLGRVRRGHAGISPDRRLGRMVARHRPAGAAACTQ